MSDDKSATIPQSSIWSVYLVRCVDDTLYTGVAKDVSSRVAQHNRGTGAKYTRGRGPVELVYCEAVGEQGDALRREAAIKRMSTKAKLILISDFK
jgi:predicted GIY-YIG superfamily endonuclease